jgi:Ni/Co efflux regulator RcnB
MKTLFTSLLALSLAAPTLALAQDDALEDILNEEESATEERKAVESGDMDDRVGVKSEDLGLMSQEKTGKRRLIKTLQRKNFLKIGRFEVGPHLGFVTNDPFINRYLIGANAGYHITEVFGLEL